jgi:hypothetical protein
MKRLIKLPIKVIWRLTHPLRRPVVRRVENLIRRCAVQPPPQVHVVCRVPEETGLIMDHMVRELVRLQTQLDRLQQMVEDLLPSATNLSVVGSLDGEDDEGLARSAAG